MFARQRDAAVGREHSLNSAFNIAVLSLLGWVLVWFSTSGRFYVDEITVKGNTRVPADVIRQVSGLQGYNRFWVHPQRTATQIMEVLPPVESVRVRYGLSGNVSLQVTEREKQIVWQVSGVRYWVDGNGHLRPMTDGSGSAADSDYLGDQLDVTKWQSAEADELNPRWLLLVNDIRPNLDADGLQSGTMSVDPDVLVAAYDIMRWLPEVRVVEYAPDAGLRFLHSLGWQVCLGTGNDIAHKVEVLRAFEAQFANDPVQPTLVDLRYPDTPYCRMPGDASSGSGGD